MRLDPGNDIALLSFDQSTMERALGFLDPLVLVFAFVFCNIVR